MANDSLTAAPATGAQTNTQTPQSTGQSTDTIRSGNLQPGTTASLLSGGGGVSLNMTPLSTVNLDSSAATTTSPIVQAPAVSRHINPMLVTFPVVLLLIAGALFLAVRNSGKTTV